MGCLAVTLGWLGFAVSRTPGAGEGASGGTVPVLAELLRERPQAPGWAVLTRLDLGQFADVLQTTALLERTYQRVDEQGRLFQITVYLAYWHPGQSSVSAVATHTPDACWPGAGWEAIPRASGRVGLPLKRGGVVAGAEERAFRLGEVQQWVWFWHLVGGKPLEFFDPRSWRDQLRLFFARGVKRDAQQAFVRLSSNRAWAELAAEPLVVELLAGLTGLGLPIKDAAPVAERAGAATGKAEVAVESAGGGR